ncbi:MAG: hypothetical protein OEY14_09035 [Myxococcales bacterium]|nr:hypothetical protein [Myxococcales bacterium]
MVGVLQDVHIVREVLEASLPADVATAAMFAALQGVDGGMPSSKAEVLALCRGPLAAVLAKRVGAEVRDRVLERLEQVIVHGSRDLPDDPLDVDIDISEGEPSVTLTMPIVFREPVSVVVVSARDTFAARLEASLGAARVHANTAADARSLRRAVFSEAPLLVLVDTTVTLPGDVRELGAALGDLPGNVVVVVWGAEKQAATSLLAFLDANELEAVRLQTGDGFAPLLDLILARYAEEEGGGSGSVDSPF